jgi:hypothetical protein
VEQFRFDGDDKFSNRLAPILASLDNPIFNLRSLSLGGIRLTRDIILFITELLGRLEHLSIEDCPRMDFLVEYLVLSVKISGLPLKSLQLRFTGYNSTIASHTEIMLGILDPLEHISVLWTGTTAPPRMNCLLKHTPTLKSLVWDGRLRPRSSIKSDTHVLSLADFSLTFAANDAKPAGLEELGMSMPWNRLSVSLPP